MTYEQSVARYQELMHAVQSGVAWEIELDGDVAAGATPKHLRTGINSDQVNNLALVTLLIDLGVFTREQHIVALVNAAESEVKRYEELLTKRVGKPITLI